VLTIGTREALCVVAFAVLVWGAHALVKLGIPYSKSDAGLGRGGIRRREILVAGAFFTASFLLSLVFARPLWEIAERLWYSSAGSVPRLSGGPPATFNVVYFRFPLLIALFLSAPAWTVPVARLLSPAGDTRPALWPSAVFVLGGVLGIPFVLPAAIRLAVARQPLFTRYDYWALLWNSTLGPALVLLVAAFAFHALKPRIPIMDHPERRFVWLTPGLMFLAAVATATRDVFQMTVVFLPMCVSCLAGILAAEAAAALAKGAPVPMSRVLIWGFRFCAESLLGAGIAVLILTPNS
jgi:hypothetical protein